MPPPNTAGPGRSIWQSVDQSLFVEHVLQLCTSSRKPIPWISEESDWPEDTLEDLLSFRDERQLADDFAFIAANEYNSDCVTAATVEPSIGGRDTIVRLAANFGIKTAVREAFVAILALLERCATKSRSYVRRMLASKTCLLRSLCCRH